MTASRPLARGAAVLAAASLVITGSMSVAAGAAGAPGAAAWPVRTVLREDARLRSATQVVSLARGADYALVPVNRPETRFQLRRISLATGSVTRAGRTFSASRLRLASGFLWVYGPVFSGKNSSRVRVVLHQVSASTLRTVRSWTLLPTRRLASLADAAVAPGPGAGTGRTVWAGFRRTLRLISVASGKTLRRARVPAGFSITDVATDPARQHLYVSAAPRLGGGAVFEFGARTGRLRASATGRPLKFAVDGSALTAVPGRVWSSYRTGMMGQTILLRRSDLSVIPLNRPIFEWAMNATTVYGGGTLFLSTIDGVIGCLDPRTGATRARATLPALRDSGDLITVDARHHEVYGMGTAGLVRMTAPRACWLSAAAGPGRG